jgi:hypothetical protein
VEVVAVLSLPVGIAPLLLPLVRYLLDRRKTYFEIKSLRQRPNLNSAARERLDQLHNEHPVISALASPWVRWLIAAAIVIVTWFSAATMVVTATVLNGSLPWWLATPVLVAEGIGLVFFHYSDKELQALIRAQAGAPKPVVVQLTASEHDYSERP